jgi:hypothetical protein
MTRVRVARFADPVTFAESLNPLADVSAVMIELCPEETPVIVRGRVVPDATPVVTVPVLAEMVKVKLAS